MSSLNFTWKKKVAGNLQATSALNGHEAAQDEDEVNLQHVDWQTLVGKDKQTFQEQPKQKSERLYNEGITLAEEERYWEAINRWDEALEISSLDERIHEMKSQVLMELGEIFPAVESAERAVNIKPTWAEAYQTLGRAQLNIGEIQLALKCFERLKHLRPDNNKLWEEDIAWTTDLVERKKDMEMMCS